MESVNVEGLKTSTLTNIEMSETASNSSSTASDPSYPDTRIVKTETFDKDVMKVMLNDTETIHADDRKRLSNYYRGRKNGTSKEVIYSYGKGCEEAKFGRLYAKNSNGLQGYPFDIRNPLLAKHYWDIDIENAHFNFLPKLADTLGVKAEAITRYATNRAEELRKVSDDKWIAKLAFLKVAYGGNLNLYSDHLTNEQGEPAGDLSTLKAVEAEVRVIREMLYSTRTDLHYLVKDRVKKGKDGKIDKANTEHYRKCSLLALYLQNEEKNCLLAMDEYLISKGRGLDILIHDGGMVKKLPGETEFPLDLMRGAEGAIYAKTGYKVKLVQKPIEHNFKMPELVDDLIDDSYAAKRFVELMKTHIQRDGNAIWYYNPDTGLWATGVDAERSAIERVKEGLIFKTADKTYNYGGSNKMIKDMLPFIKNHIKDTAFISKNRDSSRFKMLFSDGYYDFQEDKFVEEFDENIVFFATVGRPFRRDEPDEYETDPVEAWLFGNAFDDGTEEGKQMAWFWLKIITKALMGDYRMRKMYMGVGPSACGKSLTAIALKGAFGGEENGYVGTWDANNLKLKGGNTEEARRFTWVLHLQGKRVVFDSEFRMDGRPIDGNALKKYVSAGDGINTRALFGHQQSLCNTSTPFLMCNDVAQISPADRSIMDRVSIFKFSLRFVENPTQPDERQAQPDLADYFATDEGKDLLVWVIIKAFRRMSAKEKKWGNTIDEPDCVKALSAEYIKPDAETLADIFNEKFVITNDPNDYVFTREIIDYIRSKGNNDSDKKLGDWISAQQRIEKKIDVRKAKKVRLGIKKRGYDDDEEATE
jgi:hypothetical protein